MSKSFLSNVDNNKVDSLIADTKENVGYFENITNEVVKSYTKELDEVMDKVDREVVKVDNPSLVTLNKCFLELSMCLYKVSEQTEKLNIYSTLSKIAKDDLYNKALLENSIKEQEVGKKIKSPTVAENQAVAEGAVIYEKTVNNIYASAYSIVKSKIQAAQTMNNTLSKAISARMAEMQLTNVSSGSGRQILNEGHNYKQDDSQQTYWL